MAVVDRPRNNLQQHLAWFNSHRPQVPPRGEAQPLTAITLNIQTAAFNVVATQPLPPVQNHVPIESTMPTPTNVGASTTAGPRRSETKLKVQEIEFVSFDSPDNSQHIAGKTAAEMQKYEESTLFNFCN
jgi:hypothetical protein